MRQRHRLIERLLIRAQKMAADGHCGIAEGRKWGIRISGDLLVLLHYGVPLLFVDLDKRAYWESRSAQMGISVSDQRGMNALLRALGIDGFISREGRTVVYDPTGQWKVQ